MGNIMKKFNSIKLSVVQVQQWLTDISATRGLDDLDDGFAEAEKSSRQFKQLINQLIEIDKKHAERYQAMIPVFDTDYAAGKEMAQAYIDKGADSSNKMMATFDQVAEKMSITTVQTSNNTQMLQSETEQVNAGCTK